MIAGIFNGDGETSTSAVKQDHTMQNIKKTQFPF